jgi:hypothetical protein
MLAGGVNCRQPPFGLLAFFFQIPVLDPYVDCVGVGA